MCTYADPNWAHKLLESGKVHGCIAPLVKIVEKEHQQRKVGPIDLAETFVLIDPLEHRSTTSPFLKKRSIQNATPLTYSFSY